MKKTYLSILVILGLVFSMQAQDKSSNDSNFGLKAGYNLAAVSIDEDGETGQRHGFHVGLYGESFITNNLALQVEVLYSQQGYEVEYATGTFTQKLDYINVPLMFKVYPTNNFFLEVGPQAGLAVSHKETYEGTFVDISSDYEPNKFDWGMNFGGGFKTDSGVSIGVRYHLGLGDVNEEDTKHHNRVWMFSLGFDL
ncbi:porin family protein [Oceanihabitans sediminis]|uniref:porin family protein n=1 Tax=Oceanihabitans sediminis TaxID=1812012 RepID=UPI003A934192